MSPHPELQYHQLIRLILETGEDRPDRTGTGTRGIFGHQMRFDLRDGFPLLTTKKLHIRSIVAELIWFLRGETNVKWLQEQRVSIWNEWADENGDLGPVYGRQWRQWTGPDGRTHDQIAELIRLIREQPSSRRQVVNAWNVGELDQMALAPCHCLFQTTVLHGRLHLQLYQRSCDVFLGLPFNIASYALLLILLADHVGLEPGEFVWTGGDVHIYHNHFDQVRLQIEREPYPFPTLRLLNRHERLEDYAVEDIAVEGYVAHPHIKGVVAV